MSGEFGSYHGGYFWYQIETAANDCLSGGNEITRVWGRFFKVFCPIADAISWNEAGDSGPDDPILQSLKTLPLLKEELKRIEEYLEPFKATVEAAVRQRIKDDAKKENK